MRQSIMERTRRWIECFPSLGTQHLLHFPPTERRVARSASQRDESINCFLFCRSIATHLLCSFANMAVQVTVMER